jgi:hypothetical protein
MPRTRARITHDEVVRLIKDVQSAGLPIARVSFDGVTVEVVVGKPDTRDRADSELI